MGIYFVGRDQARAERAMGVPGFSHGELWWLALGLPIPNADIVRYCIARNDARGFIDRYPATLLANHDGKFTLVVKHLGVFRPRHIIVGPIDGC